MTMNRSNNNNCEQQSNTLGETRLSIMAPSGGASVEQAGLKRCLSPVSSPSMGHLAGAKRLRSANNTSTTALAAELMKTKATDLKASLMAGSSSSSDHGLRLPHSPSRAALALKILRQSSSRTSLTNTHHSHNKSGTPNACMSKSPSDRRLEIASMLERATQFAHVLEHSTANNNNFRHCASTPLLSPRSGGASQSNHNVDMTNHNSQQQQQQQQQQQPAPAPRRHRYRRRNSFVIHRDKPGFGLLGGSGGSSGFANATFDVPAPPQLQQHESCKPRLESSITAACSNSCNASKNKKQWPLGLNQRESHLVLTHMASSSSADKDNSTQQQPQAAAQQQQQQQ